MSDDDVELEELLSDDAVQQASIRDKYIELHTSWMKMHYFPNCTFKSTLYRQWKSLFDKQLITNPVILTNLSNLETNKDNVAIQCMHGFHQYIAAKYGVSRYYLERAYSKWPHPLILCCLADILCKQQKFEAAIKTIEPLFECKWEFMMQYITSFDSRRLAKYNLVGATYNIYDQCIQSIFTQTKISRKWLCKALNIEEQRLKQETALKPVEMNNISHNTLYIHQFRAISKIIRLNIWNNQYQKSFEYILRAHNISKKYQIPFDFHTSRSCYLLLLFIGNVELCQKIRDNQLKLIQNGIYHTSCHAEDCYPWDTLNGLQCEYNIERNKMFHQGFCALFQGLGAGRFDDDIFERMKEFVADRFYDRTHCTIPILGAYFDAINDIEAAEQCFASLAIEYVSDSKVRKCESMLCLEWWFFWIIFARFMRLKMRNLKKTKYMLQIVMKCKVFDGFGYYLYSILMRTMGKYQTALKYWKKYKKCKADFEIESDNFNMLRYYKDFDVDSNELNGLDFIENECHFCGEKGYDLKKCQRCKAVFYCSRKCQKIDWKRIHRKYCSFKSKLSAEDKLYPYLLKATDYKIMFGTCGACGFHTF